MEREEPLLQEIYRDAVLCALSIPRFMSLPQSRDMDETLRTRLREYSSILARAQSQARRKGETLYGPGPLARAAAGVGLRARASAEPSPTRLAELMIQDSTGRAVRITRRLHRLEQRPGAEAAELARRLLQTEERAIRELMRFL